MIKVSELTFYGGVGEIGGNKILLQDEETKVFLDFGKNFGKEKTYYEYPFLSPKNEKQLLNLGFLPEIDGIYKDDPEPTIDGVLITHPHLDHWGYTCFLDNDIPLYCGEGTKNIILNYEYSGSTGPKKKYYLANLTKSGGYSQFKDFNTFRTGDTFKVGSLRIIPVHVDHSVPAAYGYIIKTSSKTIAYTGDFRLHGPKSEMSEEFIDEAAKAEPDILITEGTNITGGHISSEEEVESKLNYLIRSTPGLVVASFSQRDIDRLKSVYKVAKKNDRKIAISTKQAFLVSDLQDDPHMDIFDLQDENVIVFAKEKSQRQIWEKNLMSKTDVVPSYHLNSIQDEVVMVASYYDMNELMDIDPVPGSVFILSKSEPFDEQGEIQHEKLLNWCEHYGLPQYQIHASGHVLPHQLKNAIKKIDPKKVIPVHTDRPVLFKKYMDDLDCEIELPVEGGTIEINL